MSVSIFKDNKCMSGGSLLDAARFTQVLLDPMTEQCTLRLQQGKEAQKELPVATWNAFFPSGTRSADKALDSGFTAIELKGLENAAQHWSSLAHLTHPLRIVMVFRNPANTELAIVAKSDPAIRDLGQRQLALANAIGCPTGFAADGDPCKGYPIYHEKLWLYQDCGEVFRDDVPRVSANPPAEAAGSNGSQTELFQETHKPESPKPAEADVQTEYKGIALKRIAEEWLRANKGTPSHGAYTNAIYELATRLRHITEYNPMAIFYAVPHYNLGDEEVKSECVKACRAARGTIPFDLKVILEQLENETAAEEAKTVEEPPESLATIVTPPLPPIFKQFCDSAPDDFKQASVLCLLPILGTLGSRLRGKYLNGKQETPSFNVALEAPQASGKSFIEKMTARCLQALKKKDDEGHELERQYQEEDKMAKLGTTKGERKDRKQALEERKIPIIRKMPATASITKLLIRMENAQGLHLFALAVEIDTVHKAFKRGFSNLSDLLRCAFDNSEYGQDYATDTSYSGNLPIYYNTLYSGTPKAIRRFYPDSEDGTLSRTLFVTFPDQFGKPMPIWREFTDAEDALVEVGLTKLYEVSLVGDDVQPEHEMDMSFLNKRLDEWLEEQRQKTLETQDRTRNTFYRRCAEVAFRAGMVAWYLWDENKNSRIKSDVCKFAVWVAEKMLQQFLMRVEPEDESGADSFFAKVVYNALPEQFTREQLEQKLREFEFRTDTYNVLARWKKARCIEPDGKWGSKRFSKKSLTI